MTNHPTNQRPSWWRISIIVALLPLFLLVVVLTVVFMIMKSITIQLLVWTIWCPQGRDILFVYSDSPVWHDYIAGQILPHLGDRAVVLNWSERRLWQLSLARTVFRTFGGNRDFNPLAIVFRPFRPTRVFRFYVPFHELKRGSPESLQQMQADLFRVVGICGNEQPGGD